MRIGFDGATLYYGSTCELGGGVEWYSRSLLKKMVSLLKKRDLLLFIPSKTVLDQLIHDGIVTTETKTIIYGTIPFFSRHLFFPLLAMFHRASILFCPGGQLPLFWLGKSVVTIHDTFIYDHPEWFPPEAQSSLSVRLTVPRTMRRATRLLAVSHATETRLHARFSETVSKTCVVYPGCDVALLQDIALPSTDIILCIGTIEPRKNYLVVLEAFRLFLEQHPQAAVRTRLVIVGKRGWNAEPVFVFAKQLNTVWRAVAQEDVVTLTGFVTEDEKKEWLLRAALVLFVSLDEGFGFPLLEACSFGKVLVASDTGSLPELGGDAVLYVDPSNARQLALTIAQCLFLPEAVSHLKQKVYERSQLFSWNSTVAQTIEALISASTELKK